MSNKQMTASTSVRIRMDDVKVFGPGIAELLERIDRCESIRTATMEMKIAYSKAWTSCAAAEAALGYPLIQRKVGRRRRRRFHPDAGGAFPVGALPPVGGRLQSLCQGPPGRFLPGGRRMNLSLVVLAAGASRRFGAGNKLLQLLDGKPLLCHTLELAAALPVMQRGSCLARWKPLP
ncbi:MAG: NTP transferase domain-containing protein [Angelakisella sp.]